LYIIGMGKKYNTEEERLEGRKATRRESYYRKALKAGKIPKPVQKRLEQEQAEKLEQEKGLRELLLATLAGIGEIKELLQQARG